jgi:general secretion pathway protein F
MPEFNYEAIGSDKKVVRGKLMAESLRDAQRQLKTQGFSPVSLEMSNQGKKGRRFFESALTLNDQILVLEELSVLLKAGVSLSDAVESISTSDSHPEIVRSFQEIDRMLKRGEKFSSSLQKFFSKLPNYVYQLIGASELTGKLDEGLKDSVEQLQYDARVKGEIQGALTYPAILLTVGLCAVLFIFIVVVPKFEMLFQGDKRKELPWLADVVMSTGIFISENIAYIGGFVAFFVILILILSRQEKFRMAVLSGVQKTPLIGVWLKEAEIGRWSAMLAIMLRNKIPLMQSLELARSTLSLPAVRQQMNVVSQAVRGGSSLASALRTHTQFPSVTLNLVRVGEQAGNLDEMLWSLATLFERSGKQRMKKFLALLEPLSIILIGGFIGLIITGIILGLTSLGDMNT